MSNLIWSKNEIRKYIEQVLPKLEKDEIFIMFLLFRRKYTQNQQDENFLLDRKIVRSNDSNLIIQEVEKILSQKFFDSKSGKVLPNEGKVLYFDPNPKSMIKAYNMFVKEVNDQLYSTMKNLQNSKKLNYDYFRELDIQLLSCVHKSQSRTVYWLIDIDKKDEDLLNKIIEIIEKHIKCVIETYNGYHLLINVNNEAGKLIYEKIKGKFNNVEFKKQFANPLPGTLQGRFRVKILKI